jgi:zinc protease
MKTLLLRCLLILSACCLAVGPGGAAAQALPAGVTAVTSVEGIDEFRLPNGLQVLLVEDPSKPTTTVNLTYHVGSRHENYGETGMAHLLEHLLFKGSPKHPKPWIDISKRGLRANGTTWYDRTNYTASFSANADTLRWSLGWLADSMVNSHIARRDLDSEMTVVRNEMERGENRPDQMLFQRLLGAMYDWHNYGKDTIGARADVENVDVPRLRAFYRRYYQPDNATLIVAGAFDRVQTLALIAQSFGPIPKPRRTLPTLYTLDPAQDGERSVTLRRVGGTPLLYAGYHVPAGTDRDSAAAELLALVLGDTPSGRLHTRLTEKGLAAGTFGYTKGMADPGFLVLGAQLAPGQGADAARDALVAAIEGVAGEPVTAEELERARAKWLKDWEAAFTDPEVIGLSLSESIAQGDWRLFFLVRDWIKTVTLADVQRVAGERLRRDNRTVATYLPTEQPLRAPAPKRVAAAEALKDFQPASAQARAEAFDPSPANIDARTRQASDGSVRFALLPKATRGGAVQAVLTLRFGDVESLTGGNEVGLAVANLLDKGSATLSRQQVQDRLDALRTSMAVDADPGRVAIVLTSRREQLPQAIALVGELLRAPAFPADAFAEYRRLTHAAIEERRKEPEALAALAVQRAGNPYPPGDPRYTATFDERIAAVDALTVDALRDFHRRFYGAQQAIFAAVGDFDPAAVRSAVNAALAGLPGDAPFARIPTPYVATPALQQQIATPDKQNATFIARLALPLSDGHADYPALLAADYLLGGGLTSRLWMRIRETEGLSYDVRTRTAWGTLDEHSIWQASADFAPQNRAKVEAAFREELAKALRQGFTAAELAEGQRALLNFRRLARAQDDRLAMTLAQNVHLGRTMARAAQVDAAIGKLTLAQVNEALRRHIDPARAAVVFAGDFR